MGYGVKVDHTTGRELNLDKTYKNIIKPAVEEMGLKCIRADELIHSGTIDYHMYNYLVHSDIVIADLSTYNPNAFYELGVRHGLRPYTTIAIAEEELKNPFDIEHTVIRKYEHLGKDIGYDEVQRFREELKTVIKEILDTPQTDSPVYTFLKGLKHPEFIKESGFSRIYSDNTPLESERESLSTIIEKGKTALENNDFLAAKLLFRQAHEIDKNDSYIIQNIVLATYKSELPTYEESLFEALRTLDLLTPNSSTDPETLGLAGAIHKRLWEKMNNLYYLNQSIKFYEKGFYIKRDYYNGINFAFLLNVRGSISEHNNAVADYILANRVRQEVIEICNDIIRKNFKDRSDKYWVIATLEEASFGLNEEPLDTVKYLSQFNLNDDDLIEIELLNWKKDTSEIQFQKLKSLLEKSPL